MANEHLTNAKRVKNDEFYTQYADIQKEIEAYLEYNPDTFRGKVVPLQILAWREKYFPNCWTS